MTEDAASHLCSKCGGENTRWPQRYCRACHRDYQRAYKRQQARELKWRRRIQPGLKCPEETGNHVNVSRGTMDDPMTVRAGSSK